MNIPKIEEAITLLYQTFIEDQDVATQRGIAITAMNEMVRLLGGVDVVAKIESVPYSARLKAQHLFEDEPPQRTEQEPVAHWSDCAVHSEPAYSKGECNCGGFNPVAWLVEDVDGSHLYWTYKQPIGKEKWTPLFLTQPQRTWVVFPTMLRKMWSGSEVQAWLDENVNKENT